MRTITKSYFPQLLCFALAMAAFHASAQQPAGTTPRAMPQPSPNALASMTTTQATATGDAAEVLALERKIEDAVIRGDVAFVDGVTPSNFAFTHGDGWTHGGKAVAIDDKKAFLKRVENQEYLVHDPDNVRVEQHGDVIITYGRYVSLFIPKGRAKAIGHLNTIWFERVYQKQGGKWMFLSHRTVHGPTVTPAGVDPTALTWDTTSTAPLTVPGPAINGAAVAPDDSSPDSLAVMDAERQMGKAIVDGNIAFYNANTAYDFIMTHSDRWIRGGKPLLVDDKASFGKRVANKSYVAYDLDSVKTEMHGDVAITYGRYIASIPSAAPDRVWFYVWYEKVYAKRDGKWMSLSHRTVNGANYAPTREALGTTK